MTTAAPKEYAYSTECKESQNYTSGYSSVEEALKEAELDIGEDLKIGIIVWVGEVALPALPTIDVDRILEQIGCNYYDEYGENAGDYLRYVKKEHEEELEEKLNAVLSEWVKKYNYEPDFYKVEFVSAYVYDGKGWKKNEQ